MTRAIDNPFSVDHVLRVRFRPQGCSWDDLMSRLARLNYRAAVVGPRGSGKTTLLEDLGPLLEARGFRCIFSRCDEYDVGRERSLTSQGRVDAGRARSSSAASAGGGWSGISAVAAAG
jgi:hypothetical protein